ncbi:MULTISPECIES: hypothetical protein [Metallosphaera]|uniref:KEOPS complex Pcc1-like subunit n=2 Tax=Metallosphaera TaxID=41980 RepID=F4G1S2_METCR|nr:hypothetical protein [Metallosphaera cuprina]AEB96079.1 conserved hypothetical protein [Metallosphaera cuprina Ar-4]
MMITINISLKGLDKEVRSLVRDALLIEDIDKHYVKLSDDEITISCETASRCRAIMNSYIFWIYSVISTLNEVDWIGRKDSS